MIAEVIVDVAAHQTDRVFEYHIPDDLEVEIGQPGSGAFLAAARSRALSSP